MNAPLPPVPDLPWTATHWAGRHVSNLIDTQDFVQWATAWGMASLAQDAELMERITQRAQARGAATPSLPELHRALTALIASAGGQAAAPVLSFHLNVAFARHCLKAYPTLATDEVTQRDWGVCLRKAGSTAQRSALVAVSQRLDCPCGGLGVWRAGMLKNRARPAKKAPVAPVAPQLQATS